MNRCGYYSCKNGKPKCSNPAREGYPIHCDRCKRSCGGIYPSQLPKLDLRNEDVDIIDNSGRVLNK